MTTWFVFAIIAIIAFAGNSNLKSIPEGLQNLTEYKEFIRDLAKTQIGEEEYVKWVPFLELFSYLFSYQIGLSFNSMAFKIPNGELAAPTNDITTVALSLLTSIAYFYAGISKRIRLLQTLCVTSRVFITN
jgi:F-type H+-transporting ATPase subunit a